jgi:hypothetical protein
MAIAYDTWLQQEVHWPSESKSEAIAIEDMPYKYLQNARGKLELWGIDLVGDVTQTPLYRALRKRMIEIEGGEGEEALSAEISDTKVLPSAVHLALTSADPDWRQWNPIDLAAHVASHLNGDPL